MEIEMSMEINGRKSGLVQLDLPLRTVSINRTGKLREHMKRKREHRLVTAMKLKPMVREVCFPCVVTLTRLSRGRAELDDDNIRPALKHVRDGVADALGHDDSKKAPITWEYAQIVRATDNAVRIEIRWGKDQEKL